MAVTTEISLNLIIVANLISSTLLLTGKIRPIFVVLLYDHDLQFCAYILSGHHFTGRYKIYSISFIIDHRLLD